MKKTTFTLLLSLCCCWLAAQCPVNITFSTQGQIDSFQINYPGCTEIENHVIISGAGIANLQGLSALTLIGGNLRIENNPALSSLSGLESLDSIRKGFLITNNDLLVNLQGVEGLTYVGLFYQGLPGGGSVTFGLNIEANATLTSLSGLDSLNRVKGPVEIWENFSLASLNGLENLDSIGGSLSIFSNDSLVSFNGLNNLQSIEEGLTVEWNGSLKNFIGLENLKKIGATVWSLGAFNLRIENNWQLQSLSALDNIDTLLYGIIIGNNSSLTLCAIQPICAYLQNGGPATISDNAPGCNSLAEVEAACMVSIEETSGGEPAIVFSPNPAGDFLQIQVNDPEKWHISLFDLQGRQMFRQTVFGNEIIEVKDWPSGIYTLQAVSGGRVFSGKIVKQ